MHADQDPGRLLLLCLWATALPARPRHQLCAHGAGHVPGHQVSSEEYILQELPWPCWQGLMLWRTQPWNTETHTFGS